MNLGAAGFWLYLPINQLRKNGPNYLDNTHRSGKGLKITQMCRFKPWVLSIFLLTKKMPCLIRNNHKFGERNTSCCVTSWEVQTIWTCLKTARLSRRRNKKNGEHRISGDSFFLHKSWGKNWLHIWDSRVPGVPGFWLGDWEQFQSLQGNSGPTPPKKVEVTSAGRFGVVGPEWFLVN